MGPVPNSSLVPIELPIDFGEHMALLRNAEGSVPSVL